MTVKKASILGPVNPFDTGTRAFTDTYSSAEDELSTSGGIDSHLSRDRGEVAAFRAAQTASTGERGEAGSGFALTSNMDSAFSTMPGDGGPTDRDGDTPSQMSGAGKGIAGEFPMTSARYKDSDTGSDSSGYGKTIR